MRAVATGIARLLLAGVATCAIATCHHDVPPLQQPALRDVPTTSFDDRLPMHAVPAAVAPNKPPLDASVDGPVSLPPVPDAGLIRDAGTPM